MPVVFNGSRVDSRRQYQRDWLAIPDFDPISQPSEASMRSA